MSQLILNFTSRSENIRYFVAFHKLSHQSHSWVPKIRFTKPRRQEATQRAGTAVVEDPGNSNNHPQNIHQ